MNRYKIPFRLLHPNALRNIAWTIGILLAVYGLWYSVTSARAGYQIYTQHEALVMAANERADNAMADVVLAMRMLEGKVPVVTVDGMKVARIEWKRVELVRGLR